jgi:hypothetical protein
MLRGGLPGLFLAERYPEADYREWIDGYWAKDIQTLFRLERRDSFERLLELVFVQSGGIFEAASVAAPCGLSHTTVRSYLQVLEATFVVHVVRPYHGGSSREIIRAPKVYGFDTGLVCYFRGWESLRPEDHGTLWEHLVLNELFGTLQTRDVHYWRDKSRQEVDFVIPTRRGQAIAIEAKWSASAFEPRSLLAFRSRHPGGANLVVAHDVAPRFRRQCGGLTVDFVGLSDLPAAVRRATAAPAR